MTTKKNACTIRIPSPKYSLKDGLRNRTGPLLPYGYLKSLAYKYGLLNYLDLEIIISNLSNLGGDKFILDYLKNKNLDFLFFPALSECNFHRSVYLAEMLKKENPRLKVIVSGTEVSGNTADIIKNAPFDIGAPLIFSESSFGLIANYILGKKINISASNGIFCRDNSKIYFSNPDKRINRIKNMPSPYLMKFLNLSNSATLEGRRGKREGCIYCKYDSKFLKDFSFRNIKDIKNELIFLKRNDVNCVSFVDFIFNRPDAWFKKITNLMKNINTDRKLRFEVNIRPDMITDEQAKILKQCNFLNLRTELHTINPAILKNNGKNINIKKWIYGINLIQKYGIETTVSVIAGMPGDNLISFKKTIDFLTENQISLNTECFPLFVDPCSSLWKKALKMKINFQKEAPHLIIDSPHFSFNELKEALSYASGMGCKMPSEVFSKENYPLLIDNATKSLAGENIPISRIITDLDGRLPAKKLYSLAQTWSNIIANAIVIWFKGENLAAKTDIIKNIMKLLSKENPYTVWNIVLESKNPVLKKTLDEIEKEIVFRPHNLDYQAIYLAEKPDNQYYRCATRFYIIYDKIHRGQITCPELAEGCLPIAIKYHTYYSLTILRNSSAHNKIKKLFNEDYEGCLFDFDPEFDMREIKELMNFIKLNNWKKKTVLFRKLNLQHIWDLEFNSKISPDGEYENAVII